MAAQEQNRAASSTFHHRPPIVFDLGMNSQISLYLFHGYAISLQVSNGLVLTQLNSMRNAKARLSYNRLRLVILISIIGVNSLFVLVSMLDHHYPLGVAPILFLIPCLLRELDLKSGRPLRRIGSFEWSCFVGGVLFLAVLPFFIMSH